MSETQRVPCGSSYDDRPTVAVVGGGISVLTAAYLLQRGHHVTLFEADPRIGGHAHTPDVDVSGGRTVPVDSGFIVLNVPSRSTDAAARAGTTGLGRAATSSGTTGGHYALTLQLGREQFLESWPDIARAGFGATFRRMWEFYLADCEAGFRTGYLDVAQLTPERLAAGGR